MRSSSAGWPRIKPRGRFRPGFVEHGAWSTVYARCDDAHYPSTDNTVASPRIVAEIANSHKATLRADLLYAALRHAERKLARGAGPM